MEYVEIKKLECSDITIFKELIILFEDVFEMKGFTMPGQDYLQKLLDKESFIVFVASLDKTIIGGLTSYVLDQYYSSRPLIYIFDLAVKREF